MIHGNTNLVWLQLRRSLIEKADLRLVEYALHCEFATGANCPAHLNGIQVMR